MEKEVEVETHKRLTDLQDRKRSLAEMIAKCTAKTPVKETDIPECIFCGSLQREQEHPCPGSHFVTCDCNEMKQYIEERKTISEMTAELQDVKEEIERWESKVRILLSKSGLGRRFRTLTVEESENGWTPMICDKAREYVETFVENKGTGLLIVGDVGTGKTHFAAAVACAIAKEYGLAFKFISSLELVVKVQEEMFNKGKGNVEADDRYAVSFRSPLYILDDLGQEARTEFTLATLFRLIDSRYAHCLPTIITTNLSPSELYERYGETFYSRVIEDNDVVIMNGSNRRMQGCMKK